MYHLICTPFTGHPVKGVFFVHYNYEYKRNAVELYRQGKWPDTPESIKNPECFRAMIRRWARIENAKGPEALKHQGMNKAWTPEEKLELITKVLAGNSITSVALEAGINDGMLYRWVRKYEELGYNGLIQMKKGRPMKNPKMKTINDNNPRKLNESEYEELLRLRAENEYIKAEIEVIKKEIALREEKEAAQLKAKKQRLLKNYTKKDIN